MVLNAVFASLLAAAQIPLIFVIPESESHVVTEKARESFLAKEGCFFSTFNWNLVESDFKTITWPSSAFLLTGTTSEARTCVIKLKDADAEGESKLRFELKVEPEDSALIAARKLARSALLAANDAGLDLHAKPWFICQSSAMVVFSSDKGRWVAASDGCSTDALIIEPLTSDFGDDSLDAFEALAVAFSVPRSNAVRIFVLPDQVGILGAKKAIATPSDLAVVHQDLADAVFLPRVKLGYGGASGNYLLSHEIGHLLLNQGYDGHVIGKERNLMRPSLPKCKPQDADCPMLTESQIEDMWERSWGRLLHPAASGSLVYALPDDQGELPKPEEEFLVELKETSQKMCLAFFKDSVAELKSGVGPKMQHFLEEARTTWSALVEEDRQRWKIYLDQIEPESYRDYLREGEQ